MLERARTVLYESGLPLKFWAEAIAYVAHAANLTPRKNKVKTPYETWYNKIPNISYLKTFGCIAYYYIHKNARNKLQPSGRKAIMLGYSRERVAYRLYDIEREAILEERSVVFDENVKGNSFLTKQNSENNHEIWDVKSILDILDIENTNINVSIKENVKPTEEFDDSSQSEPGSEYDEMVKNRNEVREVEKYSRGRSKGLTSAESLKKKEEMLKEREERLRKEGVRRSERLNKNHHAQMVDEVYIPSNVNEARNNENWQEAMENEISREMNRIIK